MNNTIRSALLRIKDHDVERIIELIEIERKGCLEAKYPERYQGIVKEVVDHVCDCLEYAIMIDKVKDAMFDLQVDGKPAEKIKIKYLDALLALGKLTDGNDSPDYYRGVYDSLSAIRRLKDK